MTVTAHPFGPGILLGESSAAPFMILGLILLRLQGQRPTAGKPLPPHTLAHRKPPKSFTQHKTIPQQN